MAYVFNMKYETLMHPLWKNINKKLYTSVH